MRPLIGLPIKAPAMAGTIAFWAAAMRSGGTPHASPIAASQSAVPSRPTGADPTTLRPAASNSRIDAV